MSRPTSGQHAMREAARREQAAVYSTRSREFTGEAEDAQPEPIRRAPGTELRLVRDASFARRTA